MVLTLPIEHKEKNNRFTPLTEFNIFYRRNQSCMTMAYLCSHPIRLLLTIIINNPTKIRIMPHQNSSVYAAAILSPKISVSEEPGERKGRKKKDFVTWTILYSVFISPEVGSKGVQLSETPPWPKAKHLGLCT